jgi:DNA-binding LytR/AlgR family response regulator
LQQVFTNPDEAKEYLEQNNIDLIFLDIQMPDINGIQLYKNLKKKPAVIFTTAFKDFAVEGFDVDAIDYLLKPIEYDRFLKAANKAKEYLEFLSLQSAQSDSIFLKVNYEIRKITLKEIELIEALDDYVKIYLSPVPVLTLMTLKNIAEKLPAQEFMRVHRSYIIPLHRVEKFNRHTIWINGRDISIGSSYTHVYDKLVKLSKR